MKISELGEFAFIRRLASRFSQDLPKDIQGIGDDCAIIPYLDHTSLLITTDLLIENVHFIRSKISAQDLGYKSIAVNLSDIAAMGGCPLYTLISIGLPSDIDVEWIDHFFDGMEELAKQENVLLLGGDTTFASEIAINFVIIGKIETSLIKKRSQAKAGDIICCTNNLGDSGAGLKIILEDLPLTDIAKQLIQKHNRPFPAIHEGQWLASQNGVHAMIDVSDGIDSDIRHIMEQSHCGAVIDLDRLPLSADLDQIAKLYNWNAAEIAATAGEDYCLLVTIDPIEYEKINSLYNQTFKKPLFKIGQITDQANKLSYLKDSFPVQLQNRGFDHFKK